MFSNRTVYGEYLERPLLKFDSTVSTSTHLWPMSGISAYGPYDKSVMQRKSIRFAILYPQEHDSVIGNFIHQFCNGVQRFPGYLRWFRQSPQCFERYPISDLNTKGYEDVANQALRRNYDLIFVVTEGFRRERILYQRIKTKLLEKGIPSQFLSSVRLYADSNQLQWILSNIALSVYAKMGGTPWVIEAPDTSQIILGMSRALDPSSKVIVGFTVVFKQNGDFVLSYSKSPVTTWPEYEKGVEDLVYEAVYEYAKTEGEPEQIAFHFTKRPGRREIESVNRAVSRLDFEIKYALIHVNSTSGFHLFDTSDPTRVPIVGLKVNLSNHGALLLLGGRDVRGLRPSIGTPSVLDVSVDKRSTVEQREYHRLIDQVFNLAFVNWRGFNARTIPVTTYYGYLMAKIIGGIESIEEWNLISNNPSLMDKAWFL